MSPLGLLSLCPPSLCLGGSICLLQQKVRATRAEMFVPFVHVTAPVSAPVPGTQEFSTFVERGRSSVGHCLGGPRSSGCPFSTWSPDPDSKHLSISGDDSNRCERGLCPISGHLSLEGSVEKSTLHH